jgi:hypothetical protein
MKANKKKFNTDLSSKTFLSTFVTKFKKIFFFVFGFKEISSKFTDFAGYWSKNKSKMILYDTCKMKLT